jgi:hypothetical protein
MHKKKVAVTLSAIAILNLSAPAKASAFDLGGFIGGFAGSFSEFISPELAQSLNFYTQLGQTLLKFIDTKSLESLASILPSILGQFGGAGGLAECSGDGADCSGLIGEAGEIDWGKEADAVESAVVETIAASDQAGAQATDSGQISAGVTDPRFRPRVTTQVNNTKIATWTQLQDSQFKARFGEEGQKLDKQGQEADSKVVEESAKTTTEIAGLDNTQDILKKSSVQDTLSMALQQRSLEEQRRSRNALYEGNQTTTHQLSIEQKQDWRDEVERARARESANIEGKAFASFIDSGNTPPSE